MKRGSPGRIVLVSAISVFICVLLLEVFAWIFPQISVPLYHLIIIPAAALVIAFTIFYSAIEKFIYDKIRVIYKIIHDLRSGNKLFSKEDIDMRRDILGDVNDEVFNWAKDKSTEIETLKKQAIYRKEFLGNVSHELKTPIMSIQGYLDTLADGGIYDERINKVYIEKALRNTERLAEIVNDLESIARLESGEFELKLSKFDICNLTLDVFESFEFQARDAKIKLEIRPESNREQYVHADQKLIREVLVNLVSNAIKYGKENGKVEVGFYEMGDQLLIEIADDGTGISPENLNRVFERFFRAEKSRTRDAGGTGLGLAIVKHVLEAHGQTVSVTSKEGEGSVFSFSLDRN